MTIPLLDAEPINSLVPCLLCQGLMTNFLYNNKTNIIHPVLTWKNAIEVSILKIMIALSCLVLSLNLLDNPSEMIQCSWISWCPTLIFTLSFSAASTYCRPKVFSLSTYYLNGALPCNCNFLGSYSNGTCPPYAGQCSCKPGTTGRQCDTCQIQFYGMTDQGCQRRFRLCIFANDTHRDITLM